MMDWQDRLYDLRRHVLAQARRFDARPKRERVMIMLAVAAVLLLAGDRFWLSPAFRHFSAASSELAAARADQQLLADESERRRVQGDAQRRELDADIAQWRQRTAQGAQALADTQAGLIGPDRMVALLEQMLPKGSVRIVGLKTLAPQDARLPLPAPVATPAAPATASLTLPGAAASAVPALAGALAAPNGAAPAPAATAAPAALPPGDGAPLYRHGVEITVEGNYGDLMGYLSALESLPGPRLLWGGIKLKVEKHPTVQLSLTVYTLSLDRAWLEL
jgi:MSHA biogenesis protein MshJ